jgi:gluconolactonase
MNEHRVIASGLRFPEGPIAMPDGSVLLVEIERGTLTRVTPDGGSEIVADLGGGPNGAAIGPDGRCYVCNNGGFKWHYEEIGPGMRSVAQADDYSGGRIEAVDLKTGQTEVLYTHCGDVQLRGPNDIVFDREGGFYFTDLGKVRARDWDRTGIYYARIDGGHIEEIAYPMVTPNGVGLSADETTLYVAETWTGRLWAFDIAAPGKLDKQPWPSPHGGRLVGTTTGFRNFDSLAVEADGRICIATLMDGGITVVTPDGASIEHVPMPDPYYTTNICFGGQELKTAYITESWHGTLIAVDWPRPGLPLNFLNK